MNAPHAIVIGGGHNGLVCAAYLADAGASVTLLERREILGGACVTEELWPGCRISRAAYVLSLFRPRIARELELKRHGLELLPRTPSSFTPLPDGRSLVLGPDRARNVEEIARFSKRDARVFPDYEALLERVAEAFEPTLDYAPPELPIRRVSDLAPWFVAARAAFRLGRKLPSASRLLLSAAREQLEEWFESEPLRTTLATDAVIGAFASPATPGTGYVLFHHVMGSITGARGVWAYVRGGMGSLSHALEQSARARGVQIRTRAEVQKILTQGERASGVVLENGEEIPADVVVSSADPAVTFSRLDRAEVLPEGFRRALDQLDYRSPVVKMNLVLSDRPRFRVNDREDTPLTGTIHLGPQSLDELDDAFRDAQAGEVSSLPMVELTLPSSVDASLAPEGKWVASIFAQYAPARNLNDPEWARLRDQMQMRVLQVLEEAAPGFNASIEHMETLAPPDLQRIFGLTGGNIFHGAMTPDRLLFLRPVPNWSRYRTPLAGLYLCGSGAHPGGGVMGAPGRNAALEIKHDLRR